MWISTHFGGDVLLSDEAMAVATEQARGCVPTPLRRLSEVGTVAVHPLGDDEAALIETTFGRVVVLVAESIPPAMRRAVAEHAYRRHDRACLVGRCPVAGILLDAAIA